LFGTSGEYVKYTFGDSPNVSFDGIFKIANAYQGGGRKR